MVTRKEPAANNTNPKITILRDGNIGIGTTAPIGKLHVSGSASFNAPVIEVANTADTWYNIQLKRGGDAARDYFIGRAPSYVLGGRALVLHVPTAAAEYGGVGPQPKISFVSSGADELGFVEAATGNWFMKGNVGIGTTAPGAKLDILQSSSGDLSRILRLGAGGSTLWSLGITDAAGTYFRIASEDLISNPPFVIHKISGNVGIGTTNPGAKLDVVGTRSNTISTTTAISKVGGADVYLYTGALNGSPSYAIWMQAMRTWDQAVFPLSLQRRHRDNKSTISIRCCW
jgi:hypothetical protein